MRKNKKRRRLIWHIFLVLTLTLFVLYLPIQAINNHSFQQWFLNAYHPFSPWKIQFKTLSISPIARSIALKELTMTHPKGHKIQVKSIFAKIRPLRLFWRGQLHLEPVQIESPMITVAQTEKTPEKKKFKLRTLLILQNLLLDKGQINNLLLNLPKTKLVAIEKMNLSLEPALLGGTRLAFDMQNNAFQDVQGGVRRAEMIHFKILTNLDHWSKTYPFVDDVKGDLSLKEVQLGRLTLNEAKANILLDRHYLSSKNFSIRVGGNALQGSVESDLVNETYSLDAEIPHPVTLPELGPTFRTFNFEGNLKAKLHLEGQGFKLDQSHGKGTLSATHQFLSAPDYPAEAQAQFSWRDKTAQIHQGLLTSDSASIQVTGQVGLKPLDLRLKLQAADFPIQRFFENFRDKNLHPIYGLGTFEATLDGIKQTVHLRLHGEAREGGYGMTKLEKALVDLDLTYNQLKLNGKIFTGGKTTGEALLTLNYGPPTESGMRTKKIALDAKFMNQPLNTTLPSLNINGDADAALKITGTTTNILGEGTLTAKDGGFMGIGFDTVVAPFKLTSKQLVVQNAEFSLTETVARFTNPLIFDFVPGGFRLSGKPVAGLDIQASYQNQNKMWQITRFQVQNMEEPDQIAEFSGVASPDTIHLNGRGVIDLKHIQWVTEQIREASGPAAFNLTLSGALQNLIANGEITFKENSISLRHYPVAADELKGTLHFHGNRVETKDLEGLLGTGAFRLLGSLTYALGKPTSYDLYLNGDGLYWRNIPGNFRMEYDADIFLKGQAGGPTLSGSLTILDAHYTRDFNIIEELKTGPKAAREIQAKALEEIPIHLDLKIKNLGDFIINNNVGRIELSTNLKVSGTRFAPKVEGSIEVTEGEIIYLGLNFDIIRGFMEFRDPGNIHPYMEVDAEREMADVHITAKLHGHTNNLNIDLAGSSSRGGPLEKKDVLSLALFGMTTSERAELVTFEQFQLGPELVAEQIAHVLQRPIARVTGLDIFRLEALPTREGRVQRFYLGKRLSDRFIVEFTSEINRDEAIQTFQTEYWLTDFLIFKAARTSDENFRLNLGVRLKGN